MLHHWMRQRTWFRRDSRWMYNDLKRNQNISMWWCSILPWSISWPWCSTSPFRAYWPANSAPSASIQLRSKFLKGKVIPSKICTGLPKRLLVDAEIVNESLLTFLLPLESHLVRLMWNAIQGDNERKRSRFVAGTRDPLQCLDSQLLKCLAD